jgi:PPOX class probable F420-dependent enzyme
METSSFKKNVAEWLAELNDPQAEHRRDVLTALADSGALDDGLIDELRLVARGDPDAKAQSLAKRILESRGIKILPQLPTQPGARRTGLLLSFEFWAGFFLFPIFNFILGLGLLLVTSVINENTNVLQLVLNIALLIYFWFTRKKVALGMLAFFIMTCLLCGLVLLSWQCWPNGCAVPRQESFTHLEQSIGISMIDWNSKFGRAVKQHLESEYVIWLTTIDAKLMPQPRPVWFLWQDDAFLIFSKPKAHKVAHIEKNPNAALHFNTDESGDEHVIIFTGEAVLEPNCPPAHRVPAYFEKYKEGIADLGMTAEEFSRDFSVAIKIKPTAVRGWE